MEITAMKRLIKRKLPAMQKKIDEVITAERYYRNENDILRRKDPLADAVQQKNREIGKDNPLRNADNRISHPWHRLLVNQKASYTMTIPPTFDTGDKQLNAEIPKLLGDSYAKVAKDLCVDASNAGIAWVHVWIDENNGFFRYAEVDTKQIIPIFSKKLDTQLVGLLRVYEEDDEEGNSRTVYEYWNDQECVVYQKKHNYNLDQLMPYNCFTIYDASTGQPVGEGNRYRHPWGEVPFIPFRNAPDELSDLKMYKASIDVYDKVYAGFVNDLDDIQEIIFILTNYSGEDKDQFMRDLKGSKVLKLESDGPDDPAGVDTMMIEIPTEARDKMLELTREAIFVQGQGVDPQKNIAQNNSGVALKHMYSLLELKASALETEFRQGFAKLVRFILKYFGADPDIEITQTWTRTSINNDLERAQIVSQLASITSKEAIAKANPIVDNWSDELDRQDEESRDEMEMANDYRSSERDVDGG
ncbi:MAG: phage portal protein [Aerococcus sp.]|nr:phage portal protein [Aerococcus sp.]